MAKTLDQIVRRAVTQHGWQKKRGKKHYRLVHNEFEGYITIPNSGEGSSGKNFEANLVRTGLYKSPRHIKRKVDQTNDQPIEQAVEPFELVVKTVEPVLEPVEQVAEPQFVPKIQELPRTQRILDIVADLGERLKLFERYEELLPKLRDHLTSAVGIINEMISVTPVNEEDLLEIPGISEKFRWSNKRDSVVKILGDGRIKTRIVRADGKYLLYNNDDFKVWLTKEEVLDRLTNPGA